MKEHTNIAAQVFQEKTPTAAKGNKGDEVSSLFMWRAAHWTLAALGDLGAVLLIKYHPFARPNNIVDKYLPRISGKSDSKK